MSLNKKILTMVSGGDLENALLRLQESNNNINWISRTRIPPGMYNIGIICRKSYGFIGSFFTVVKFQESGIFNQFGQE